MANKERLDVEEYLKNERVRPIAICLGSDNYESVRIVGVESREDAVKGTFVKYSNGFILQREIIDKLRKYLNTNKETPALRENLKSIDEFVVTEVTFYRRKAQRKN